jgi:hypothetical protein
MVVMIPECPCVGNLAPRETRREAYAFVRVVQATIGIPVMKQMQVSDIVAIARHGIHEPRQRAPPTAG